MSAKFSTPKDRKRLLHSFYDLPLKEKEMLYRAVENIALANGTVGARATQP